MNFKQPFNESQQEQFRFQYKNPIIESERIQLKCSEPIQNIAIQNINGQFMYNGAEEGLKNIALSKGVYFLSVVTQKGTIVKKIIAY